MFKKKKKESGVEVAVLQKEDQKPGKKSENNTHIQNLLLQSK